MVPKKDNSAKVEPKIGIFWCVEDRLVIKAVTLREAPVHGGMRDIDADHFAYWTEWAASCRRDLLIYSYDHFPRGRITYNESDRKFTIMGDRCLISKKSFIVRIKKAFGLPVKDCVVLGDIHYQCHKCNPFFVPDSALFEF